MDNLKSIPELLIVIESGAISLLNVELSSEGVMLAERASWALVQPHSNALWVKHVHGVAREGCHKADHRWCTLSFIVRAIYLVIAMDKCITVLDFLEANRTL